MCGFPSFSRMKSKTALFLLLSQVVTSSLKWKLKRFNLSRHCHKSFSYLSFCFSLNFQVHLSLIAIKNTGGGGVGVRTHMRMAYGLTQPVNLHTGWYLTSSWYCPLEVKQKYRQDVFLLYCFLYYGMGKGALLCRQRYVINQAQRLTWQVTGTRLTPNRPFEIIEGSHKPSRLVLRSSRSR